MGDENKFNWGNAAAGFGMGAAEGVLGGIMGMAFGKQQDKRQLKQQEKLNRLQIAGQKEMTDYNYSKQLQMWKDTSYGEQRAQMEKAGLNPALLYGMGGGGGQSIGGATGSVNGGNAPSGGGEAMQGMGMALQMGLMKAQLNLTQAQADKTRNEANNIGEGGVQNKGWALDNVIKDLTGKTNLIDYEIREAGKDAEMVAWNNEQEARQAIASNITDLWQSGKLKQKSLEEIEQLLLSNAKSREEKRAIMKNIDLMDANLKGKNIENSIQQLELQLQQKTGIDKNSNGWLKILGRLFVNYMSQ